MGRAPCCDKANVKRGPWSPEEDMALRSYLEKHGTAGNWIALPQKAGLKRCGKSCRLRWLNYLRPDIKHGGFTEEEDNVICTLYNKIGSRWSVIASQLPGRTDNDVKNYWNTKLKKRMMAAQASLYNNINSSSSSTNTTTNTNTNTNINTNTNTDLIRHNSSPSPATPLIIPTIKTKSYTCDDFLTPLNEGPSALPPLNPSFMLDHNTLSFPIIPDDASTASSSATMENSNNYVNWSANEPGGDDAFLADFGFGFEPPSEFFNDCYGYQQKIGEDAPNQATLANMWVTSETKPQVTYS